MANTIIPKRSSVAAKVPLSTDLQVGEIAINLADGLIFTKNASGTVITLGGSSSYLPLAGGTLTGLLTLPASTATAASLNLPHGVAPTTPVNGDVWTTTANLFARVNGVTYAYGGLNQSNNWTGTQIVTASFTNPIGTATFNVGSTSQTTGTITMGGNRVDSTGAITIGQSQTTQTLGLHIGATASGATKTLNIGSGGLLGSATSINIGSSVSGATTTVTAYGAWSITGSLNVVGAITQNGSQVLHAGNYTSYSPSLTGSGASGSWGISVTGSAGSVAWSGVTSTPTTLSGYGITDALLSTTAASTYLPLSGGTLTGGLTVGGNMLLSANAGGARTIGFASGTDTTLVLQGGGASGAGANLELTRDNIAYLDATLTRLRSQDGATNFLEASVSGVNVMTGALTESGNQVVHAGNVSTYALPIAGGTLTGNLGLGTGVTPLSLLHLGTTNPEIRFDDDDASGVVQLRQTIGTFLVTIDPTNVDANSAFLVRLDNADAFTLNTTGATFTGGITAPSFTGKVTSRVVSIAEATSITMDADSTDLALQVNTLAAGTLTINAPTGTPVNGQRIMLRLTSSNVQTFAWNAVFRGSTDQALPTASSGATKEDYLGFIYDSVAGKWDLIAKNFGF